MNRTLYFVALIRFILALSFSVMWPFIPLYLSDRGLSPFEIGVFLTGAGLIGTTVRPLSGALSDRFGRVRLINVFIFFRAIVLLVVALCVLWDAPLWVFFLLLLMVVFGFSAFVPVIDSYVADIMSERERILGFGWMRLAINGGFALGSFLASFVLPYGYAPLFLLSSSLVFIAAFLSLRLEEGDGKSGSPVKGAGFELPNVGFMAFALISTSVFILSSQLINNFGIFAKDYVGVEKHLIAYLFTLNGLLIALLQIPFSSLLRRVGYVPPVLLGGLGWSIAFLITLQAHSYLHLVLAVLSMTLAEIITVPVVMASATNRAPFGRIGAYMGFWSTFQGLGYTLGPAWGGFWLDRLGRGAWAVLAFQSLLTGVLLALLREKPVRETPKGTPVES